MKITAEDLLSLGVAEKIIEEPIGGAHNDLNTMVENISDYISDALEKKMKKPIDELLNERYTKFRKIGEFEEFSL